MGFLLRPCSGKRPYLAMTGELRGFSQVNEGFLSYDGELRDHPDLAQGSPISIRVTVGAGDYSRVTAGQIDLI